ncbi:MAG TPA: DUF4388 domain-containing protein [Gemmatimonadaceae bacterium]|jgi:hypothetical protein|nr:DUF4388 domain-containing protein [Gemmatimonadaceae bacterium]
MAIEGPLRELGIHDVFQLIDLSRKSGALRVSSGLRDDEGLVYFEQGRVVKAALRSRQPNDGTGAGARSSVVVSKKERERQRRVQIESVVFELMSWSEGFISFEECDADALATPSDISLATGSLLMEGARRVDEWSRIAQVVPSASAIPALAPVASDRDGPMLDLLPTEWRVLSLIDGARDVRTIAERLEKDEFEISRIVYGLATTGIIAVRAGRASAATDVSEAASRVAAAHLDAALAAVRSGDFASARASCEQVLRLVPGEDLGVRAQTTIDALAQLERALEAYVHV